MAATKQSRPRSPGGNKGDRKSTQPTKLKIPWTSARLEGKRSSPKKSRGIRETLHEHTMQLATEASGAQPADARSRQLSVRIPGRLIERAKQVTGIETDSDLIRTALANLIAPNAFGLWLIQNEGALPDDFVLDV